MGARHFTRATRGDAGTGRMLVTAIQNRIEVIQGDEALGKRYRAVQELGRMLEEVPDDDPSVCKVCRGSTTLIVGLMTEAGEMNTSTRNAILSCLAALTRFLPGSELIAEPRMWALLLRMLYQAFEPHICISDHRPTDPTPHPNVESEM